MNKKVLVLSTSLRKNGNSDILAENFIKGALESHNIVEKISLIGKKIEFCVGCLSCQKTKKCVINDDMEKIIEKIKNSDVVVFATPIYYYEMSGQMKTLLDRTNPLFAGEYKFRDIYLLATSADTEERAMDGALKGLEGWIECFEKAILKGIVRGVGADTVGSIKKNEIAMKEAYEMGKNI